MRVTRMKRWAGPLVAGLVVATQLVVWAPAAVAQQAGGPVELRGFATGQPAHISALESGGTRLANAEVAWSGAAVDADADGLKGAKKNEVNRIFQPDKANKLAYARGSGLEIGIATTPEDPNEPILAGLAEQDALPNKPDVTEQIEVPADPIAYASLVRGTAHAKGNESLLVPAYCVLGDDLARGTGFAADAELLDAGGDSSSPQLDGAVIALDDQDPDRSVSQSTSRETLIPRPGASNVFGLQSEVRQTIAPVTLLQADDDDPTTPLRTITIEVLGEWVLRAQADGNKGSIFYGPGTTNLETPILRIIDSDNAVTDVLKFQDIFGPEGLTAIDIPGVVTIAIGEDPRAIAAPGGVPDYESKPTVTATKVSGAVDVVRLLLLSAPDPQAADIRVGHMEVSTEVPATGVSCPIPVTKTADPQNITISEDPAPSDSNTSHITITVHNVYDCDMQNTVLVDHIKQHAGTDPDFKLISGDPPPDKVTSDGNDVTLPTDNIDNADVTWNLGTIPKGKTSSVKLDLQSATRGGIIRDIAEATAKFANCTGQDVAGLAIAGLELAGLSAPVDIEIPTAATGPSSLSTALSGGGLAAVALALGFAFRRRRFLRKT